jgi:hypothetical protein
MILIKRIVCTFLISIGLVMNAAAQIQVSPDSNIGLDQITVLVSDLALATSSWRLLGFSVQPPGDSSNTLILMADGTSLRLTTEAEITEDPQRQERDFLEGPVAFSFRVKDPRSLTRLLLSRKMAFTDEATLLKLDSRYFNYLSFIPESSVRLNGPWSAHPNGAISIIRVWIATDRSNDLAELLTALGGEKSSRTTYIPERARAKVVAVSNGEVVIAAKSQELFRNRPIIGATILIADIDAQEARLARSNILFKKYGGDDPRIVVAPEATHGMWLEFRE